jgi:hypothetical protein
MLPPNRDKDKAGKKREVVTHKRRLPKARREAKSSFASGKFRPDEQAKFGTGFLRY